MSRFTTLLVLFVALLTTACGAVATPEWAAEAQETRVAQAATFAYETSIAPTATPTLTPTFTPEPPTATPIPPTNTPQPPTNTPEPPTATFTATPIEAADDPEPMTIDGDPAAGEVVFNTLRTEVGFACATCHNPAQEVRGIGPALVGIAQTAETRIEGQSAIEYIYNSIVHPNDYIVTADPPYPMSLMPQIYGDVLTEQELNDLIAYLLTL